ncbi:MAG: polyprenol phosphomannose-dependent alpha 1,6 mannosyltransferase MptB, partial [Anaerolineales bacterium]|nr:polyprenol phosphomannose-dependent alpha 1,6 mannosyltransferase MptB [Anaerolineales bacterium]
MSDQRKWWGVGSGKWGIESLTPYTPLPTLFFLTLLGYLLLLRLFPLIPRYNQTPLADVRTFTPSLGAGLAYGLLLLALYGLYGLAYQRLQTSQKDHAKAQRRKDKLVLFAPLRLCVKFFNSASLPFILLTTAVFALPLLFTYPINANDVYRYFIRGRITAVYATSPYSQPPASFATDPYLPLAGEWADATSPYSPVWELTAAAITHLAPDNLLLGLLLFKLLGLGLHLLTAVLIHHILKPQPTHNRLAATLLWAWNPALLLFFVTDAHNDTLMLLWLTLGILVLPTPHTPHPPPHPPPRPALHHAPAFLP